MNRRRNHPPGDESGEREAACVDQRAGQPGGAQSAATGAADLAAAGHGRWRNGPSWCSWWQVSEIVRITERGLELATACYTWLTSFPRWGACPPSDMFWERP